MIYARDVTMFDFPSITLFYLDFKDFGRDLQILVILMDLKRVELAFTNPVDS